MVENISQRYCSQLALLLLFAFFIAQPSNAQTTVYAHPYPKGIVTDNLDKKNAKWYTLYPINNRNLRISIHSKELIAIRYASGKRFFPERSEKDASLLFSTDSLTGKIRYAGKASYSKRSKRELYEAFTHLSLKEVRLKRLFEDNAAHSFQYYQAELKPVFAGDLYSVTFLVKLWFEDGEVTYELTEFERYWMNIKSLDELYASSSRNGDVAKFWQPVRTAIHKTQAAISYIKFN